MDRFDDMVVFQIIARTGTISAAALEIGVAPSAVSRRLKALEGRLGVQLVQRTTRKLTLTPSGDAFLAGAGRILSEVEALEGGLQARVGSLSGPIRLTAPLSFGLLALPDVLDGFMRQHPGVELDLHLSDARVDLISEGFDLAIRIGQLENSALKAKRLCDIDFVLCMSPEFLSQHRDIQTPEQLTGKPGCIYTGESQTSILQWTAPDGSQGQAALKPVVKANNGDVLRDLAVRGHGIVCGPRFIVHSAIRSGQLVAMFEGYRWANSSLYAVYPPTTHMPVRLRAIIDFLTGALRSL